MEYNGINIVKPDVLEEFKLRSLNIGVISHPPTGPLPLANNHSHDLYTVLTLWHCS